MLYVKSYKTGIRNGEIIRGRLNYLKLLFPEGKTIKILTWYFQAIMIIIGFTSGEIQLLAECLNGIVYLGNKLQRVYLLLLS